MLYGKFFSLTKLIKYLTVIIVLITFTNTLLLSQPQYTMELKNGQIRNGNEIEFDITIKSKGSDFNLTSYQCSFYFKLSDNDYSGLDFNYISGTSEMSNKPDHFLVEAGNNGYYTIAFASNAGNDVITNQEKRVGRFRVKRNNSLSGIIPVVDWNFDGNINTILTGNLFSDITYPDGHKSQYPDDGNINSGGNTVTGKLPIITVKASSTSDPNTSALRTIDGKGYNDGDPNSRWASNPMPQWLIFDLGQNRKLSKTRFSFYNFNQGRIYQYNVKVSQDMTNWQDVLTNVSSKPQEWSEETFPEIIGRYVKLEFLSSTNNPDNWATLWEAEIWGTDLNGNLTGDKDKKNLSVKFELYQNYPNPFNPSTTISFNLKEDAHVTLQVFNALGQKVKELVNNQLTVGIHKINFNANNLSSGLYFYRIIINNTFIDSKRMMLVK